MHLHAHKLQSALKSWSALNTSHWRGMWAVTLTFKQALKTDHGWMQINQHQCDEAFRHFLKRLNKAVYGNATRRYGKALKVIAVTEKDATGRWHKHVAIEPPEHMTPELFELELWCCWNRTHWGHQQINVKRGADRGWVNYMLKLRQKSGLDAFVDCIDLNSLKC